MTVETARRLIGSGFSYPLAAEIARAIDAGTEDYRRLMALGVPVSLAKAMAEAISGEDITARTLVRLGMNAEQAKIFTLAAGGSPPASFVWLMDNQGNHLADNNNVWLYVPAGA